MTEELQTTAKIANKFVVLKKINYGSFGELYRGQNTQTGDFVAIKTESKNAKAPMLLYECKMYKNMLGSPGFPVVHYFGVFDEYNVLIMDLLGPSLEDLFHLCKKRFSPKTTLMLADQMLQRLEILHYKTFLHRDQKPDNYCIGRGRRKNLVYIIDFGLCKRYWTNGSHIPLKEGRGLVGTVRYSSLNTHDGLEYSRRDDLESFGYVVLRFIRGSLPWQGIKGADKAEKYLKIHQSKQELSIEELCRGLPSFFVNFFGYVRNLRFEQDPDYGYMRRLIFDSIIEQKIEIDFCFDWNLQGILTDDIEVTSRKLRKQLLQSTCNQQTESDGESTKVQKGDDFQY